MYMDRLRRFKLGPGHSSDSTNQTSITFIGVW